MDDPLLEEVFKDIRWSEAITCGEDKEIDRKLLKKLCCKPARDELQQKIANGKYAISPPHEAQIPKDDGSFRTVYVNKGIDRILLAVINDTIFEICHGLIHQSCKSYQKGIGCGKTVQEISKTLACTCDDVIGVKIDLTKYFDSVPIQYIDDTFTKIENITGKSSIINLLKNYYHTDIVLDLNKNAINKYSSLRQGCAFAAFLADASLYDIDEKICQMDVKYVRYSDDILIIGHNWETAYETLKQMLSAKSLTLNPKKVEILHKNQWFKFLGFSLKDDMISLSETRIKTFQKEIENRTIKQKNTDIDTVIKNINDYLYHGPDGYCWASSVLPVINSDNDIQVLNSFIMDAIRASLTGKQNIGGIGINKNQKYGIIMRGTGKHVNTNKEKIPILMNYTTLKCMQNAILASKQAFEMLTAAM